MICVSVTMICSQKLVVEKWRLTRLPAKMTLIHALALLSIETISYSKLVLSYNLLVAIDNTVT